MIPQRFYDARDGSRWHILSEGIWGWSATHEDYTGDEDDRALTADSVLLLLESIDEFVEMSGECAR